MPLKLWGQIWSKKLRLFYISDLVMSLGAACFYFISFYENPQVKTSKKKILERWNIFCARDFFRCVTISSRDIFKSLKLRILNISIAPSSESVVTLLWFMATVKVKELYLLHLTGISLPFRWHIYLWVYLLLHHHYIVWFKENFVVVKSIYFSAKLAKILFSNIWNFPEKCE